MISKALDSLRRPANIAVVVLLAIVATGLYCAVNVLWKGLGITNLTDSNPWGLWISLDLSSIALSAGAFTFATVVYIAKVKRYIPLARTAVFIGLTGYTMAVLALMLDLGRPQRFWRALVHWNIHSPLWEVTMCITLYLIVLVIETAPLLARWSWLANRLPRVASLLKSLHKGAPVLAWLGLLLSLMHQASLGATYGVLKARPIWFRPGMAVIFTASAAVAGPALTILVADIASRLSRFARSSQQLIEDASRWVGLGLLAYLYLRLWDTLSMFYNYLPGRSEGLSLLTSGHLSFNFLVLEIGLGIIVPIIILLRANWRSMPLVRSLALLMVVVGVVASRWNFNAVGQMVQMDSRNALVLGYSHYTPALIEIGAAAGIVAFGGLALMFGVRHLRIVDQS